MSYDVARDFVTVGAIGSVPNVMIIAPSKGFKTVQDYVAWAKANRNAANFATVGVGSAVHLSAERFRLSAGFDAVHIPLQGRRRSDHRDHRRPESTTISARSRPRLPHIREGRLLGLAVSSPTAGVRAARHPDHPGIGLSGFRLHVLDGDLRAGEDAA